MGTKSPNTYPLQPNAPLRIVIGLHSKWRNETVRFRPTEQENESWAIETTLANWVNDFNATATPIWSYAQPLKQNNVDVQVHYTLRLANVTAPVPSTGGWVQAKQNYDGALSDLQFTSMDVVRNTVEAGIQHIQTLANY